MNNSKDEQVDLKPLYRLAPASIGWTLKISWLLSGKWARDLFTEITTFHVH